MEMISANLQKSLVAAQHKLWMAIKEHQTCEKKLSGNANDPQDKNLLGQMKTIEFKILEIDRWQKDLYCQLRKEIEALNSDNALHAAKLWLAEALQVNNNNHIIRDGANNASTLVNGHASGSSNVSDDEGRTQILQQNGDVASPLRDSPTNFKVGEAEASAPGSDVGSAEDLSEEEQQEKLLVLKPDDKVGFLNTMGLITHEELNEIEQSKNQRKRRRNIRSPLLYTPPQAQAKRKRTSYLQSGNAPQTRQTTARLNGTSPTPSTKPTNGRGNNNSSSKAGTSKSSNAKANTANNVPRNGELKQQQHKEFSIKQKTDNGNGTMKISSTGKTVHIPGLPPSLTVEWIDKDSTICISCRNPGSLTMCESCSSKFHVSCHTSSPASTTHCPKCVTRFPIKAIGCGNDLEILRHEITHVKKEYREKGSAVETSRAQGKGGEKTELHKALGELYKTDAAQARQQQQQSRTCFDNIQQQLPSSTLLIPITSSTTAIASASHDDDNSNFGTNSGLSSDMAEIVRQLPETSVTAAASRTEWRRLALQSSGLVQRRSTSESTSENAKQSVSLLQRDRPRRSSTRPRQQARRSLIKPRNYVTVEVICSDEDNNRANDAASENSADCVYTASEGSHGIPDLVEMEARLNELSQLEPEVFNISSGSSELNAEPEYELQSKVEAEPMPDSDPTATAAEESSHEDPETAKSPEPASPLPERNDESTTDVAQQSPTPSSPNEEHQQKQSDDVSDRDFLGTVFPGDFGFRIVIQYARSEGGSSNDEDAANTDDEQQQQHVKLEEAHLPAPLGPELKTAVPDNKSDDTTSQDSASAEKPTEQSDPPVSAD